MRKPPTVTQRTVQRYRAQWQQRYNAERTIADQCRIRAAIAERRLLETNQWSGLPERLDRIATIVEGIIEHHQLDGELRQELLDAVHRAYTRRVLQLHHRTRKGPAAEMETQH